MFAYQLIYVKMQQNYVDMQQNCVNMRDIYANIQLILQVDITNSHEHVYGGIRLPPTGKINAS